MSLSDNPEQLYEQIRATARSKADVLIQVADAQVGEGYEWGEEGMGLKVGGPYPPTPDQNDRDCSGNVATIFYKASEFSERMGLGAIPWRNGAKRFPRLTAAGYRAAATGIGRDASKARAGDVVVFRKWTGLRWDYNHILVVSGVKDGQRVCSEARGEAYGVIAPTLASVLARSSLASIYRFAWLSLGTEGGEPAPVVYPTLRYGSVGPAVKVMKAKLQAKGVGLQLHANNPFFLGATKAAVLRFQRYAKLVPDGVCGPKTWAALEQ